MLSIETFEALLQRPESRDLDFKATAYDLSNEASKASLIKDILCMFNTPREGDAYIILGIKRMADGSNELWGLSAALDDADVQSQFTERVYPLPEFRYESILYDGLLFGIIIVSPARRGPSFPLKDFGNILRQRQVYCRRGSKNDLATPDEVAEIVRAINQPSRITTNVPTTPAWDQLTDATQHFSQSYRYVLFAVPITDEPGQTLDGFGAIPWSAVIDLDP